MWTAWIPSRFLICPQMTSTVRFWFHIYSNDVIWPSCSPDLFLVKCLKDKVTRKKADDDNRSLSSSSSLEFIRSVKHEVSSRIKLILCVCVCGLYEINTTPERKWPHGFWFHTDQQEEKFTTETSWRRGEQNTSHSSASTYHQRHIQQLWCWGCKYGASILSWCSHPGLIPCLLLQHIQTAGCFSEWSSLQTQSLTAKVINTACCSLLILDSINVITVYTVVRNNGFRVSGLQLTQWVVTLG